MYDEHEGAREMAEAATIARTSDRAGENLTAILTQIVGADGVQTDLASRALHSQDIWTVSAETVDFVVAPTSVDDLSRVVAAATEAGYTIAPRGAGMSYTAAYIPTKPRTLSLDLSKMDRVLEINADDMTVTVEAGCTWSALNTALAAKGLRTPFWGPMSGLTSTIGGGLSQLNAMLGAGHYGTSSESVIGLTVVLADGRILRTGARSAGSTSPFYRHYGPDLAGLFCGDSGVFGVKAEITLRLIRRPEHEGFLSFSFKTGHDLLLAMGEIARQGLASETCAFDPNMTRVRLKRASLATDVKTLGSVIANEKSLVKGLLSGAKLAMGGRNLVEADDYSVHIICDGRSEAAVTADVEAARKVCLANKGKEIENSIAKIIRAVPFPPLNSILGPEGERWAPVHGLAALSQAPAVFAEIEALFADMAPEFEREGVYTGYLFTSMSTNALILEPVFYWPEARHALIEKTIEPQHLARLPVLADNPGATAVVVEARRRLNELFLRLGCGHFQIGRTYPYRQSRDAASWALLETLKATLDPTGALNPGALGLEGGASSAQ
jgi:FAD/FMN-containing dehydrogenase